MFIGLQGVSIKCTLFRILLIILKSHVMPLCIIILYKSQNLDILINTSHDGSLCLKAELQLFSEQVDFSQLENSVKFVLLKSYLLFFASMVFSLICHWIFAHDFFPVKIFAHSHCPGTLLSCHMHRMSES